MHLFVIPTWVDLAYFYVIAALVVWKGDWPQRTSMLAFMLTSWFENFVCFYRCPVWHAHAAPYDAQAWQELYFWRPFIFDGAQLTICVVFALRGVGYWAVWGSSILLLDFANDVVWASSKGFSLWTYLSADLIFSYAFTAVMLWGVWGRLRDNASAKPGRVTA
ncbi:MAG: hypothetical protein E7812_14065 [Phenylobacterium sp.]|nr:MAG: hypothetical protein E7812_14065 [Phenylobacterium sp.]